MKGLFFFTMHLFHIYLLIFYLSIYSFKRKSKVKSSVVHFFKNLLILNSQQFRRREFDKSQKII